MKHKSITFVIALVLISSLLLASCAQPTEAPAPVETEAPVATEAPPEPEAPTATEAPAAEGGQLEVFSWWTGGGEAAGLDALIAIWNENIRISNS